MLPNGIVTSSSRDDKSTKGQIVDFARGRKNEALTYSFQQFPGVDHPPVGRGPVSPLRRSAPASRERDPAAPAGLAEAQDDAYAGGTRMSSIASTAARVIALSALVFSTAMGQEVAPDALI